MKRVAFPIAAAICAMSTISACAVYDAEINHSGGLLGSTQDFFLYPVHTNLGITHRALVLTAALAKAATYNAKSDGDIRQAIAQINALTTTIDILYNETVYGCNSALDTKENDGHRIRDRYVPAKPKDVSSSDWPKQTPAPKISDKDDHNGFCENGLYYTNFQTDLHSANESIFSLAAVALPRQEFVEFASSVERGDIVRIVEKFFALTRATVISGARALAVGREGTEERGRFIAETHNEYTPGPDIQKSSFAWAVAVLDIAPLAVREDISPTLKYFYPLFKVTGQACFDLRKKLSGPEQSIAANNNCPTVFLGQDFAYAGLNIPESDPQSKRYDKFLKKQRDDWEREKDTRK